MKKILLISSFVILLFSLSISAYAGYSQNDAKLLQTLNIIDSQPVDSQQEITRGEFAQYILRFMAIGHVPESGDTSFADVTEYTPEADAIYYLKSVNILNGAGDGNFYPDSYITGHQAAVVVTRVLGYGAISDNIEITAAKLGLTDMTNAPLTFGKLVELLSRGLECECVTEGYTNGENTYEFKENYLSEIFCVCTGNGIVVQNTVTTLDGSGEASENAAVIGSHKLRNTYCNIDGFLGMNVDYYYMSKNRSKDNTDTLICAFPTDINNVTEINASDIISSDGKTLTYSENNRTMSINVDSSADVIYNGIACPDYEIAMLSPECGKLTYIKNGSGSDCIRIDEYTNAIVSSVTDECIYLRNGEKIEPCKFDKGKLLFYSADGTPADTVPADAVLSMYYSRDRSYLRAIYSTNVLDGVDVVETDEESLTVGTTRYRVNAQYAGWKPVLSNRGNATFRIYIDAFGEVAKLSKASGGLTFGYVISAYEANLDNVYLRILVEDGKIESVECSPKIKIDGGRVSCTANDITNKLSGGNPDKLAQLIAYKTNSEGKITLINTALNRETFSDSVADKEIDGFKISYKVSSDEYYKTATKIFGTSLPADELTKVFFVSSNPENQSREYYWTGSISSLENDTQADSAVGYTSTSQFGNAEAMVVYGSESGGNIGSETRIAVVKKMSTVINEDSEVRTRVTFITGGKLVAYNLSDSLNINDYNLSEGDLVRFAIDRRYEVSKLEMLCDLREDGKMALRYGESNNYCNTINAGAAVFRIVSGNVYDYEDGLLCISRGDVNSINLDNPCFEYYRGINTAFICVVDDDEITAGSDSDIVRYTDNPNEYSRVFITTRYGAVRDVVIYK